MRRAPHDHQPASAILTDIPGFLDDRGQKQPQEICNGSRLRIFSAPRPNYRPPLNFGLPTLPYTSQPRSDRAATAHFTQLLMIGCTRLKLTQKQCATPVYTLVGYETLLKCGEPLAAACAESVNLNFSQSIGLGSAAQALFH